MSKICILISAHKNQSQLLRLINHLKKDFDIYVHIDKKSKLNIKSFDNVKIYKKYKLYYADFSSIKVTLFLMKEALKNDYDRYIFISGQDVPLKSNYDIIKFFDGNNNEYLDYAKIKDNDGNIYSHQFFVDRVENYYFSDIVRKLINKRILDIFALLTKNIFRYKFANGIYYGSQWWNLTKNAAEYIINYIKLNPKFVRRFYFTIFADESFFQSLLLNTDFQNKIISDKLRYINWSRPNTGGFSPRTFTIEDYEELKNNINDNLFARKFDENIDNDIIDKLYKDLENSN
ncbi:beta-1,6-N-acetylglucosaminyltransferase [Brachyspira sp. G79]|uniref:beta-1,6-N-acetylglucosaminyltransferase n=1 Tax=Brachyspira sp. G79 TaxID=1358104 RepID=UPI000BBC7F34|nr:beta-1,6-N-acetylglucosaminyltransferase [Brachyspira sp. G79]PCG21030.1 glycosyl transferase [Brachyspira sp. G79]